MDRNLIKALCVAFMSMLVLGGCKTGYIAVPEYHYRDVVKVATDTVHYSINVHDSIIERVKEKGDTVVVERYQTVYKDRYVYRSLTDTVIQVDSVKVPVPTEQRVSQWEHVKACAIVYIPKIIVLSVIVWWLVRSGRK